MSAKSLELANERIEVLEKALLRTNQTRHGVNIEGHEEDKRRRLKALKVSQPSWMIAPTQQRRLSTKRASHIITTASLQLGSGQASTQKLATRAVSNQRPRRSKTSSHKTTQKLGPCFVTRWATTRTPTRRSGKSPAATLSRSQL